MMQQEQNESTPTTETVTEKTRGPNLTTKTTPMSTKQAKALVVKTRQKRADGLNSVFQLGTVSGKEYAKFMKLVKAKLKELGVAMARNMNKSLAKQFCSMSRQEIEQFLETDVEEFKKAAEARKAEMAAEQKIITAITEDSSPAATPESPTNE